MTAYFTASTAGRKHYLSNCLKIIGFLKAKNYQVIADHIIQPKETKNQISSCDFVVAETSYPSTKVGCEISLALEAGKPVLILFSQGDPPSLLAQHKGETLMCEKYTPSTLKNIIDDFISFTEKENDFRYTFSISREMADYLKQVAKKERLPKSVYLRSLIQKDMVAQQSID